MKKTENETQILFDYLQNNVCTASMVTATTGLLQKNICRYKRTLEKIGLLYEVDYRPCKVTGFKAHYITTNPFLFPQSNNNSQLCLFGEGLSNE